MTSFRIEEVLLDTTAVEAWSLTDPRLRNWPVVYALDDERKVYVGESRNVSLRFRQHLEHPERKNLLRGRVVLDDEFNKSACLDLESYLIRLFAGDGKYTVLNRNDGIVEADYYQRHLYRARFDEVFQELRDLGMFTRTIPEIENSDLFKLSPFKALTVDQASAVEDILDGLFADLGGEGSSPIVIQGAPGTGKTVVAIYLLKLLMDIKAADPNAPADVDTMFSEFFTPGYPERLEAFRAALVIPQQSLRTSVQRVFRKTPGLGATMVLSPFDVGQSDIDFDLLVVDETHRLNQRANQSSGMRNRQFSDINKRLFGEDSSSYTQLDWIMTKSKHQILLVDKAQSVRPADLPSSVLDRLLDAARATQRWYPLTSQMRVLAGEDFIAYVRAVLSGNQKTPQVFEGYDLRMFDDLTALKAELDARETEHGLARLVAGYAWPWKSQKEKTAHDIVIDGLALRWNTTDVDWVSSPTSRQEVGSIHTIQGYDLNYAGVIIGRDLRWDTDTGRIAFDRTNYFDKKGMENNKVLGLTYSDEDLLRYVTNIYSVLLTRGIRGTYVYVCDEALRARLWPFFSQLRPGETVGSL